MWKSCEGSDSYMRRLRMDMADEEVIEIKEEEEEGPALSLDRNSLEKKTTHCIADDTRPEGGTSSI